MVQVENTMTIVSTTAHVNGKSWTDVDVDVGWTTLLKDLFFCIFVFLELLFCISGTFTNKKMKNHGNQPMTIVSTTAHVNGKSWTDVGWCWCWCWLNLTIKGFVCLHFCISGIPFLHFWNVYQQKNEKPWSHLEKPWKPTYYQQGVQLTTFDPKTLPLPTGRSNWPPLIQKRYRYQHGAQPTF